ncbi:MAG: OmpA family protein [Myxococcota bacterium]
MIALAGLAWALDATGTGRVGTEPNGFVTVPGMTVSESGNLDVALAGGWANTTAEATYKDGTTSELMAGLVTANLGLAYTPLDGLRVTAGLPLRVSARVPDDAGFGLADARIGAEWALLDLGGMRLGPSLELALPTGDATKLSGGGGVGGNLMVALAGGEGFSWTAAVGGEYAGAGDVAGVALEADPGLRFGAGARFAVTDALGIGAEITGRAGLGDVNTTLARARAEALLGASYDLGKLEVFAAGGTGILDGAGVADARVLAGARFRAVDAATRVYDQDKDGFPDDTDACVAIAEDEDGYNDDDGCPDEDDDADGVLDTDDECRGDPEDRDAFRDEDGCPELDNDGDGVRDTQDRCPQVVGPAAQYGCPDRDLDGVLDEVDRCPDAAVSAGVDLATSDGCPVQITVTKDAIVLPGRVRFKGAAIDEASYPALRELGAVLNQNTDILVVEIAAFTDNEGDDGANLKLSQQRAEAVRQFLVTYANVSASRLVAQGYGESSPVASNNTADGRDRNRRVEFLIVKR